MVLGSVSKTHFNKVDKHSCQHFAFKFPVEKTLAIYTISFTGGMHML